ncbi:hypothetical protein MIND_00006300 [Mycena indigotica]|uniref:Uncharacterized protein n=1 Tax=Mycena indigotica TaxID=2126181 RepID=A0A8H6WDQ6_9AGAR|nr:uncharacterized protein MIND_00006300 [Mycena indigotica]KAF7314924.1 hypothetical protein MIND_00006300 [Mycena indigotica]
MAPKLPEVAQPHVVIIGSGVGGLTMAIELKRKGHENFTIVEKASDVGGTWRDNIYPGCSSDVCIHMYSLSTELRPDWTHTHAFQPTIQVYWRELFDKHGLASHTLFNRKVVAAAWDIASQSYTVESVDASTGAACAPITAAVLVSAVGLLEIPRFPKIDGRESFKGESFHSARWEYGIDLRGKKVAVIGSGASATQFVPRISEDPTVQVTQYCRSPSWIFPPIREEYSSLHKFLLRYVPGWLRLYRNLHFLWTEVLYLAIFSNKFTNGVLQSYLRSYMRKVAPAEYADKIIPTEPDFRLGCKRIVYDTNYLPSLARSNMKLDFDPIQRITEDGIVTSDGLQKHDVIIYSTGYITDTYAIPVHGTSGLTVKQYFKEHEGPTAYLGTAIPGFPNFFTLAGANTATGHTSLLYAMEVQVAYLLQLLDPLFAGKITSVEPTTSAADAYNEKVQSRLSKFIWARCQSWYRVGNVGKIHGLFPGSMTLFWWWLRKPNWKHYLVVKAGGVRAEAGKWKPERKWRKSLVVGLLTVAAAAAVLTQSSLVRR